MHAAGRCAVLSPGVVGNRHHVQQPDFHEHATPGGTTRKCLLWNRNSPALSSDARRVKGRSRRGDGFLARQSVASRARAQRARKRTRKGGHVCRMTDGAGGGKGASARCKTGGLGG